MKTHYVAYNTESGDLMYIPSDEYRETIKEYECGDWEKMELYESGELGNWITEAEYFELLGL